MQNNAAVFRTGEVLQEGVEKITKTHKDFADVKVRCVCLRFHRSF